MTWRDVFDDLDRKEKSVRSVIEDPSCRVGKNEIRSELSERCSARDMAELAVFRLALFDAELVNEEWKQADADARRVAKAPYIPVHGESAGTPFDVWRGLPRALYE